MKTIKSLIAMSLLALSCLAEDFVLTDDTVLKSAEVIRSGDDYVQVRYDGGIIKVKAEKLPVELQKRFKMTSEDIQARREARRKAESDREARRKEREDRIRQDLANAGVHARYLTGADLITIFRPYLSLDAREAEYLSGVWNKREALRLELASEAERFDLIIKTMQPYYEESRKEYLNSARNMKELKETIAELQTALREAKADKKRLEESNEDLRKQLEKASDHRGNTTVVVPPSRPSIVVPPYYYGGPARPIVLPVRSPVRSGSAIRAGSTISTRSVGPSNTPHTLPRK